MSDQEKIIGEIIEKIDKLALSQLSELIEKIKDKYNISGEITTASSNIESKSDNKKEEEQLANVSLKIVGLREEFKEGALKIKAYKAVSTVATAVGKTLNIIQAKKLVDEEGGTIIAENIPAKKAEELKKQLENDGIKVLII